MKYDIWTLQEAFTNFIPGFYFVKFPNRRLNTIELMYGFDGSKAYQTGSRTNALALLPEKVILYGPIPTP